uniref:Uncharacterized protein n=1 Tax=Cannabis sativa TaxID=3483 RepID=A0A803PAB1_CANSA
MGPIQVDKYELTPVIFHDPSDVFDLIHKSTQPRKRKAGLTFTPFFNPDLEINEVFDQDASMLPEFLLGLEETLFKMGSGGSQPSIKKEEKKRKMSSRSRKALGKNKGQSERIMEDDNLKKNLELEMNQMVEGLTRDPATQALLAWERNYRPICIFLMETKVKKEIMSKRLVLDIVCGVWDPLRDRKGEFLEVPSIQDS